PGCRDPGVASVILGSGNAEAVTQPVELLRIDGVNGKAAVLQSINHRPVWHLDRDGHRAGITCYANQPIAERCQAGTAVRKCPLALYPAGSIENANLVLLRAPA